MKSPANSGYWDESPRNPIITPGVVERTPAVIIIDIPLEIPYSVITSPSHIRNIVPAVAIVIAVRTTPISAISMIVPPARVLRRTIIP